MKNRISIGLAAALLMGVCASSLAAAPSAQERGHLSTKMVNLSSAVDTYFTGLAEAPADDDATLLKKATRRDARLLAPEFKPYQLKVQYQTPYAVVLLCSKDGKRAIMEDAGCSARLDRQVTEIEPCEFTLKVSQGCQVEGSDPQ